MKKNVPLTLALCLFFLTSFAQNSNSIYQLSISDIDGMGVNLSNYQGKKLLIIIAPVNTNDLTKINEIDSFINLYGDSIQTIGIMSYEHGFVDSNKAKVKSIYTSRGINIILTEGLHTKSLNGFTISSIANWLTNKSQNQRFAVELKNIVGQKFFLDKYGKLYGVLPPEIPLISNISRSYALKN